MKLDKVSPVDFGGELCRLSNYHRSRLKPQAEILLIEELGMEGQKLFLMDTNIPSIAICVKSQNVSWLRIYGSGTGTKSR